MSIIKKAVSLLLVLAAAGVFAWDNTGFKSVYKELTADEKRVIIDKGTERPYSGKYDKFYEKGTYHCKQCGAALYVSDSKFSSGCGWPSFDDEIAGAVTRVPDKDGRRTEIVCASCGGHLGHVFKGEGFTPKDTRHCVNSISLEFTPATPAAKTAYFAGGCFWGVEHLFEKQEGVIDARSGYMGGTTQNPSYQDVSYKNTGHVEVVEIEYDPAKVTYETLARLFFEIHDPTQKNGQGPDIGEQYLSVLFYNDDEEKRVAEKLIGILKGKGYDVATTLRKKEPFWLAEDYHQNYYEKRGKQPYCHAYTKRF